MKTTLAALIAALALSGTGRAAAPEPDEKKKEETDVNNPVRKISDMMTKAAKLLDKLETGDPPQEEQKKILKELDRLIELAQQSQSSSSQQPQNPNQKPGDPKNSQQPKNSGGAGSSPTTDERDVLRQVRIRLGAGAPDLTEMWGKLPEAQRDEILQLLREKLPLKYRQLLIWYFKALSEKK